MGDQRTGRLALTLTFIPENASLQQVLRDLADRMTGMIERSTDDGRNYDIQVRITADITVDAIQAEVDEYITELPLDVPKDVSTVETDGVLFKRTVLGWERIE
ncbi:MAG: hypothetical protein V3S14_03740, partial [Anaerolineae bacterium]